jgi:hypothetical protein
VLLLVFSYECPRGGSELSAMLRVFKNLEVQTLPGPMNYLLRALQCSALLSTELS